MAKRRKLPPSFLKNVKKKGTAKKGKKANPFAKKRGKK